MSSLPISSMAAYASPMAAAQTSSASSSSSSSGSGTSASANLASQDVFLQLLVAQLQNQDPEQPTDGTAFVTELAQFTTLQEDTESATDLDKLVADFGSIGSTTPATSTTASDAAAQGVNTPQNTSNQ